MGATIELAPEPASVRSARTFCAERLAAWGAAPELVETAALLVSELVTNVVLHAGTPLVVSVRRGGRLRVEVEDRDPRPPVTKGGDVRAASGRGLLLIEAMSEGFGTEVRPSGKLVWFELAWQGA